MDRLLTALDRLPHLKKYRKDLIPLVLEQKKRLADARGNFQIFAQRTRDLPELTPSRILLDTDAVGIGVPDDVPESFREELEKGLMGLCPWRKGPFDFFGISIDAEWQSWMKWNRLEAAVPDMKDKRILDIGSGNGYYMFRAANHGPRFVMGVEPQSVFYFQYQAAQKYLNLPNLFCLPVAHDLLPDLPKCFDLVLCMGVLYHRRSPIDMLKQIRTSLAPDGCLVVETLVLEGKNHICLFPHDRYAMMRNVFFIPDLAVMESWLDRTGFTDISCVDISPTTLDEQRRTPWIQTQSLEDFLDPHDPSRTIEGYPAPVRAIFLARP